MPTPGLLAASTTPVISIEITLVASVTLAVGVKVAVQVMPPSPEVTALKVPFGIVKSALENPVTASEKVKVTSDVSPASKELSLTTIPAVGGVLSPATTGSFTTKSLNRAANIWPPPPVVVIRTSLIFWKSLGRFTVAVYSPDCVMVKS